MSSSNVIHYVPRENDTKEVIGAAIQVQPDSIGNNISNIKSLVWLLVTHSDGYVTIAHTNGASTRFPAIPANDDTSYALVA